MLNYKKALRSLQLHFVNWASRALHTFIEKIDKEQEQADLDAYLELIEFLEKEISKNSKQNNSK